MSSTGSVAVEAKDCWSHIHSAAVVKLVTPATRRTEDGEMFRRAAMYIDRILKRAKPADLPIEQSTKFELVVNMKASKAIGHTFPPSFLARADQVID